MRLETTKTPASGLFFLKDSMVSGNAITFFAECLPFDKRFSDKQREALVEENGNLDGSAGSAILANCLSELI